MAAGNGSSVQAAVGGRGSCTDRSSCADARQYTRDRAITRAVQLRRRLGDDGSLLEPFSLTFH